jgi:protein-S-isoprenylcysteine O-methyltransferase Ste14
VFILSTPFDTFSQHERIAKDSTVMRARTRAIVWTTGQYTLFVALAFGGSLPFPPERSTWSVVGWMLLTASGLLTLWALWAFRATRVNLTPLVREGGSLVVTGPYRWVRHPMYSAVLLLTVGLVVLDPAWVRLTAAVLMVPTLVLKLSVEEELLHQAYPDYDRYRRGTFRLIPGVW